MQSGSAELAYYESVARLRGLAAEFPTVGAYRFDLGVSLTRQAAMCDLLERTSDAERGYREAADILRHLVAQSREPKYRGELTRTLGFLARVLNKLGRLEEAIACLDRGLNLNRKLVAEKPDDAARRRELGAT